MKIVKGIYTTNKKGLYKYLRVLKVTDTEFTAQCTRGIEFKGMDYKFTNVHSEFPTYYTLIKREYDTSLINRDR